MSEGLTTFKYLSIAVLSFAAGCAAKKCLGKFIDEKAGEIAGEQVGEVVAEKLSKMLLGISGKAATKEIDRIKANFMKRWMFRGKNLDELNRDVSKLSEAALSLSIEEGIGKPYKKKLEDEQKDVASDLKKKVDKEIKRLQNELSKSWKFSDDDIIKFVDFSGNYSDSPLEELLSEIEIPEICPSSSFNNYFKENFQKVYQIYFGELLKSPEYGKALITYQREVQKLMMEAIQQKENRFSDVEIEKISEKINQIASKDIKDAINDVVDQSLQDINLKLSEIQVIIETHFIEKTLLIEAIRGDYIECAEGLKIRTDLEAFKRATKGKGYLFFKYKKEDKSHLIEELDKKAFDYFTGALKANQTLIERIIYKDNKPDWTDDPDIWDKKNKEISDHFFGILDENINYIVLLGYRLNKNKEDNQTQIDYVRKSFDIVERIINLSVFCCFSQMNENKDKNLIDALLLLNESKFVDEKINLLYQLLDKYFSKKTVDNEILKRLLHWRETIDNETVLLDLVKELYDLNGGRRKIKVDLNQFDCYRSEIILTEILIHFSFLAKYKMMSLAGVEYHNMLGCKNHLYIQKWLSGKKDWSDFDESTSSLSHTTFLTDATRTHFINLFPFIVDYNSLKTKASISDFWFFWTCEKNKELCEKNEEPESYFAKLNYLTNYKDENKEKVFVPFYYDSNIKSYQDTKGDDMKIEHYHINRLLDSLRKPRI